MSIEVVLKDVTAQTVLSIAHTVRNDTIAQALAQILPQVYEFAAANGMAPIGPPFTRYNDWDEEAGTCDLDAGLPIAVGVGGQGDLQVRELPACTAAVAWHVGPYDALGDTHRFIHNYIMNRNDLVLAGACWEIYWTDPGEVPDPSQWRTEVFYPVKLLN